MDRDPIALRQAFFDLGPRSLLGLKAPKVWGGAELSPSLFSQFQEAIARYSGSLAFLQTQHQSAVSKLAHCENEGLKDQYLRDAIQGNIGLGVGFSQLRRLGTPLVQAVPVQGGYEIMGQVPWITGYGCFQFFILGATLPDGQALFGLLPLATTTQPTGGCLTLSQPLELAAMMSTNTVTAELKHWFLSTHHVLDTKSAQWIHRSDRRNTLNHSFFALGCARAGLDILDQAASRSHAVPRLRSTWSVLDQRLNACRDQIYEAQMNVQNTISKPLENKTVGISDTCFEHRLQLRAKAIDLAVRCAHAGVIASKGAANILNHPAQRVYREALAFSVFGQTTAVLDASLAEMCR